MSAHDFDGEVVARGQWIYAEAVPKTVEIVAFDCDYYFDRIPTDDGRRPWRRFPPNADGLFFYVRADGGDLLGCPPFKSASEARQWADLQPWGPIKWDTVG